MAFYANEYQQLYQSNPYCYDASVAQADTLLQGWSGDDQCWDEQCERALTGFGDLAPDAVDFLLMNDFDSYLPYLDDTVSPGPECSNTSTVLTASCGQSMCVSQDSDAFDMGQRSIASGYWSAPSTEAACSLLGVAPSGSYASQSATFTMEERPLPQLEDPPPQRTVSTTSFDACKPPSSSFSGVVTPFNSLLKTYHQDGQLSLEDVNSRIRDIENRATC